MNDIRFAVRQLLKHPGFATVCVLTLALGIGANTAIFSVVNGVLLRPLPYPDPDQLVTLWESDPSRAVEQERVSGPNYLDWREANTVFTDLAVSPGWNGSQEVNLVLRDRATVKVSASYTSASLFSVLGTPPLLGRALLPEEDQENGNRAAVLSYSLWKRYFNGDPDVLGRTLTVDTYGRRDYTIVGVMPDGFGVPSGCELWLPLGWMGVTLDSRRSAHWHLVIGRLKPGVTLAQAHGEMSAIQARIKQSHPAEIVGTQVSIVPLLDQALGRNFRSALLILWGVVGLVLLIACANVANLMLARAATRQREIALRLSLGAQRWRVIRQLLAESVILALCGCLLGVLLGHLGMRLLIAMIPAGIPRVSAVTLDGVVLLFTFGISILTGVLFGLAPAWQCSRPLLNQVLKDGTRTISSGAAVGRTRNMLVVTQLALSLILLMAAGLMLQSFARLLSADRGFRSDHLLTANLDFSVSGFTTWVEPTATRPQVPLAEVMERLRGYQGVAAVGAGSTLVRRENRPPAQPLTIFGRPPQRPDALPLADFMGISPGWFQALGARVLRGRDFTEADTLETEGVALINESFARRYLPDEDPIGKYIAMGAVSDALDARDVRGLPLWSRIVGVVRDIKSIHREPAAIPEVYRPYWQWPMQSPIVAVRFNGSDSRSVAAAVRREVAALLPNLPPPSIRLMDEWIGDSVAEPRLQTQLLTLFGCMALLLAGVGLYGVLAYAVAQRTPEIGVRMALGARPANVFALVLGQGLRLTLVGIVIGTVGAFALTRIIASLLYQVKPADPVTFAAASLLLVVIALLASWWPARRAARLAPMEALRQG